MEVTAAIPLRHRISTLLLTILTLIASLVLLGLVAIIIRLVNIESDLGILRDSALPRLVKLSQLSQEASATISIAPALGANPTRFEFETLLSRIKDKETSQENLIQEIGALIRDAESARILGKNSQLLTANLQALTDVVGQQIAVRKRLGRHIEYLRRIAGTLSETTTDQAMIEDSDRDLEAIDRGRTSQLAARLAYGILSTLLDPNSARFSRNRAEDEAGFTLARQLLEQGEKPAPDGVDERPTPSLQMLDYWTAERAQLYQDKSAELANEFKIKALAEENSLITNRLLNSASNEFWLASADLQTQIDSVDATTRFSLVSLLVIVAAFAAGNFLVWVVLKRRVFGRLNRVRDALQTFTEGKRRPPADNLDDEIGQISRSLLIYMDVIDQREAQLAEKTNALEQLSNQLAKYLSPQVYDSIFSGRQQVRIASSRKKLTVFFSDIAGFTETADRLESEELSQLLNHYLTEMSRIALEHGATIDKYVGDAILAFFGDPETRGVKQDALACVLMAIAMRRRMRDLSEIWRNSGIERPLQIRTGIHTGYCTVGNFGSEDRMDYTIIGGTVNTASRLESATSPGDILISYETFALVREQIHCEEHGEVEVKGIAYPVATYRVVDTFENLGEVRRHFQEHHPNIKLDIDLQAMTSADRAQATAVLLKALDTIADAKQTASRKAARDSEAGH